MRVVSNASPLIFLDAIEMLHLLGKCFEEVIITDSVRQEWGGSELPEFMEVRQISETGKAFVTGAIGRLHLGELETIVLAREMAIEIALMDDLLARRKATHMGIKPLGTLGILRMAIHRGFLTSKKVEKLVDDLISKHGMYLTQAVKEEFIGSLRK